MVKPQISVKRITPGGRLAGIISQVPLGVSVIDVGTDHGYIAIMLALRGNRVTASDIARDPLNAARRNAERYGVSDQIEFIEYDGIPPEIAECVECVIIAGMGGETIAEILEKAPQIRRDGITLVLQPQTKRELLHSALLRDGWSTEAFQCIERGRKYEILKCVHA